MYCFIFNATVRSYTKHIRHIAFLKTDSKTGSARVLTNNKCLCMLEEKKKKKELEVLEKENRKKVRGGKEIADEDKEREASNEEGGT